MATRPFYAHGVVTTIDLALIRRGFVRRTKTWFGPRQDAMPVLLIQHSRWSRQLHLNVACWIAELDERVRASRDPLRYWPRPTDCATRLVRTTELDPSRATELDHTLDFEADPVWSDSRAALLREHLESCVIPFMERGSSIAGLKALLASGWDQACLVPVRTREFLERVRA